MGGTSGAIYSILLTKTSSELTKLHENDITKKDWALALDSAIKSVTEYGGATVGDRTLVSY